MHQRVVLRLKSLFTIIFKIYWECSLDDHTVRRGGVVVAGWTVGRTIRVRFLACNRCVWALWWQGGKRRLRTSRCPCQGRRGTLNIAICPWHCVPGSRSKFGNWTTVPSFYSWNITEWDDKPQPTNKLTVILTRAILFVWVVITLVRSVTHQSVVDTLRVPCGIT